LALDANSSRGRAAGAAEQPSHQEHRGSLRLVDFEHVYPRVREPTHRRNFGTAIDPCNNELVMKLADEVLFLRDQIQRIAKVMELVQAGKPFAIMPPGPHGQPDDK
jgi:hypothetical protein